MPIDSYRFGPYTVDPSRARVERDGATVPLRPKTFALLHYLVAHADRLLTKDELMAAVWPGVVVTDDSLTRCISEIRAAIGDGAQTMLRTVPRRGYLFAEAVVAMPATTAMPAGAALIATAAPAAPADVAPSVAPVVAVLPPRPGSPPRRLAGVAFAAMAAAVLLAAWGFWQSRAEPARLTMVVLPFATVGDARPAAYLGDALTEDLTLALSRLHGTRVISSGTAFTFRDAATDPRRIGAELGVRYVLQGSIAPAGDGLRITASLVDAGSAMTRWSDQFEVSRSNLPAARDRIVARLASALDRVLVDAETERSARTAPNELDAEDLAMRCAAASSVNQGETGGPSYALCEQALVVDPLNVRALVLLATYHGERVERNQSPDAPAELARSRAWVDRALAADPLFADAHCANATVLAAEHRLDEAIVAAERCSNLSPSSTRSLRTLATLHFFRVEPERTLDYCDLGMALSPRDPSLPFFMLFKGWAYLMLSRDADALQWLRRADGAAPGTPSIMLPLVSVLARTGHDADARSLLARYLASDRTRARTLAGLSQHPSDSPDFLAFAERFKDGLRKAGMPES